MYSLYVYIYIPYKSKNELFLGFIPKPEVYGQNPNFSNTSTFQFLSVVLKYDEVC